MKNLSTAEISNTGDNDAILDDNPAPDANVVFRAVYETGLTSSGYPPHKILPAGKT